MKRILLFLMGVFATAAGHAQISSKGTDFFFAFPQIDLNPDSMLVFVTSDVNTTFTIENPRVTGSLKNYSVTANKVTRVNMPVSTYYVTGSETVQNLGCRVRSKDPVYVYLLNLKEFRTSGTFVLPVSALPYNTEFIVSSYTPTYRTNPGFGTAQYSQAQFTIIGVDDNTPVEIIPKSRTANGKAAGTPFYITLSRGQVYQVQSHINDGSTANPPTASGDLSGTVVRVRNACKRINVLSGAESVILPSASCQGREHLWGQLYPTNVWGMKYFISPFVSSRNGYLYRVYPLQDNTTIFVGGTSVGTFNRTSWYQENVGTEAARCITANKPVMVAQYMKGNNCSGLNDGDPAMVMVPASDQTVRSATVGTANTKNLTDHYVNIIVDQKFKNRVKLNGAAVSPGSFTNACNNMCYAQIKLAYYGSHNLTCDSGFQVMTYGFGNYESYAYYSGANFEDLRYNITMIQPNRCPSYPVTFIGSGTNALGYTWYFGDGGKDTGSKVTHRYEKPGSYLARMVVKVPGICGTFDSVVRTRIVDVYPGPSPNFPDSTLVCADSLKLTLDAGFSKKFLYKWQDSSNKQTLLVTKPGKYWLRVLDTSTNCTVFDSTRIVFANKLKAAYAADSALPCFGNNYFALRDSSKVTNDKISSFRWVVKYPAKDSILNTERIKVSFQNTGNYVLQYFIKTQKGCSDSTSGTLSVYDRPTATFTVDTNRNCQGVPFKFTASSTTPAGTIRSYNWQWGDATIGGGPAPSKSYNVHDTFAVRHIVITSFGCRDTMDSAVVVLPKPLMRYTVNDTGFCLRGNKFTFINKTSIPLGSYLFDWSFPGQSYINTDTIRRSFTAAGQVNFTLTATSDAGCRDSVRGRIQVYPHPTARINLTPPASCINGPAFRIKDSSSIVGGALKGRTWTLGDGNNDTSLLIRSKRYATSGTYTITLISNSNKNCKDTTIATATVYAKPNADFSISKSSQCISGNRFTFTGTGSYLQRLWTYGDKFGDTGMVRTHVYADTGTYTVRSIARNANGCLDTISKQVRVLPGPTAFFSSSPDSACLGNTTRFTNGSYFNGGSISGYSWDFGDGTTTGNNPNPSKKYLTYGRFKVRMVAQGANGCNDTIFKNVRIYDKPNAAYAVNDSTQCFDGHSFVITNNSTVREGSITSYAWDLDQGVTSSVRNPANRSYSAIGSYRTTLIVSTNFGCSDTAAMGLYVYPSPTISFTADTACQGEDFYFTGNASVVPGSIQSYAWTFGDGGSATTQNPTHKYNNSGTFTVSFTAVSDQGCSTSLSVPGAALSLVKPVANFASTHLGSRGFESDYQFADRSTGATDWLWSFGDGQSSNTQNPKITFNDTGRMRVELFVTNTDGCTDSSVKFLLLKPELMWWVPTAFTPNRDTKNEVWGPVGLSGTISYHMQLFNRWGELIWDNKNPNQGWDGTFNGQAVPEGVYPWTVWLRYIDGRFYSFRGTVTVLR
ncbi:MAG: hypothetical protein RLZZ370_335 [Bacteroidota bacterium]|jgi:gliding motility-associated-like protein